MTSTTSKFLPETELHEAIEEFLFLLKRRNGEGATSFSSRFKSQMDRVQTLIAQERETRKRKRRKKGVSAAGEQSPASSLEESDEHGGYPPDRSPQPTQVDTSQDEVEKDGNPFESDEQKARSQASSKASKRSEKDSGYGSHKADLKKKQKVMQQMLGTLEQGHIKVRPILPQSVLGHLFMRKFGLSRDQRAQVIRSTNGSSRLADVERILRASDLEEMRPDERRQQRPTRRDAHLAEHQAMAVDDQEESSDIVDYGELCSESSGDDVLQLNEEDETDQEFFRKCSRSRSEQRRSSGSHSRPLRMPRKRSERSSEAGSHTCLWLLWVSPEMGPQRQCSRQCRSRPSSTTASLAVRERMALAERVLERAVDARRPTWPRQAW